MSEETNTLPSPEPAMSDDERLAREIENSGRAALGNDPIVSFVGKETTKLWAIAVLDKARELLCPAAEAKGRREAVDEVLREWTSGSDRFADETAFANWLRARRDACGPGKAAGERCTHYWGDQSKRCLLHPGHDGECTYPLTAKDVRDFADASSSLSRIALDRLRAENASLATAQAEAALARREAEARLADVSQKRDELRAKLEAADKQLDLLGAALMNEFGVDAVDFVMRKCRGREGDEAIRILREKKAEIERWKALHEEACATRDQRWQMAKDAKAEVERLTHDLAESRGVADRNHTYCRERDAEIERLTRELEEERKPAQPPAQPAPVVSYHPDPEINDAVAIDAVEAERIDIRAGMEPRKWACPRCGTAHDRGNFYAIGTHRCLKCGYVGNGGVMFDETEEPPSAPKTQHAPVTDELGDWINEMVALGLLNDGQAEACARLAGEDQDAAVEAATAPLKARVADCDDTIARLKKRNEELAASVEQHRETIRGWECYKRNLDKENFAFRSKINEFAERLHGKKVFIGTPVDTVAAEVEQLLWSHAQERDFHMKASAEKDKRIAELEEERDANAQAAMDREDLRRRLDSARAGLQQALAMIGANGNGHS